MSLWRHWKHVVPSNCNYRKMISAFLPMIYLTHFKAGISTFFTDETCTAYDLEQNKQKEKN